jgi:hypothetical protein
MYYLIRIPGPSLTKTCALQVFRVVRCGLAHAADAGAFARDIGKDIADAWTESGKPAP